MTTEISNNAIALRKHRDPPNFWVRLAGGSIALHAILLAVVLPLSVRLIPTSQTAPASVPIEMIELEPNPSTSDRVESIPLESPLDPLPAAPNPQPPVIEQAPVAIAPSTPVPTPIAPSPTPFIEPGEPLIPTPPTDPITPAPVEPSPDPSFSPAPTLPPAPSAPPLPAPPPLPQPEDSTTPAPIGGTGNQDSLPDVEIDRDAAPTRLTANIVGVDSISPDEAYDIPQVLPSPINPSQSFTPDPSISDPLDPNSCILDPESQRDLGQEVPLQLVIEPNGQVQQAILRDQGSSLSLAYVELATCLVKTWQFNPAYNTTENGSQPVFSDHLIVRIVINSN